MKDNFLDRMQNKLTASGVTGRQDLILHDAQVIEAGRAVRVLATYSPLKGPPSVKDVRDWVESRMGDFSQAIVARTDTIACYPEMNAVSFIIEQRLARQPMSAAANMVKAGIDRYLDNDSVLWEVVNAEQGPAYIVRKDGISIEQMLDLRKAAMRAGSNMRKNVTLASLDAIPTAAGGYANVDIGDVVDFYNAGLIHRGTVSSVGSAGVKIGEFTVDPQAITNVVEKSAASVKEQDDVMRRYFSLVYPGNPEMTEKISPTSSKPISDPRPLKVEPIETITASTGNSARPQVRVLGKAPGARAAKR